MSNEQTTKTTQPADFVQTKMQTGNNLTNSQIEFNKIYIELANDIVSENPELKDLFSRLTDIHPTPENPLGDFEIDGFFFMYPNHNLTSYNKLQEHIKQFEG